MACVDVELYIDVCHLAAFTGTTILVPCHVVKSATRAPAQYKDSLSRHGDSHVIDKTVARPFYLKHGDPNSGKTTLYIETASCLKVSQPTGAQSSDEFQ